MTSFLDIFSISVTVANVEKIRSEVDKLSTTFLGESPLFEIQVSFLVKNKNCRGEKLDVYILICDLNKKKRLLQVFIAHKETENSVLRKYVDVVENFDEFCIKVVKFSSSAENFFLQNSTTE